MDILGKQIFIAGNVYGVSFINNTKTLDGFHTAVLRFYMVYPEMKPLLNWEEKVGAVKNT